MRDWFIYSIHPRAIANYSIYKLEQHYISVFYFISKKLTHKYEFFLFFF